MSEQFRGFFAVEIEKSVKQKVLDYINFCKEKYGSRGIRWLREEQIHITLKFLGNISPALSEQITQKIKEKVKGFGPFRISLKETGVFPSERRPRVFWIGVDEGKGKLAELNKIIEKISRDSGIPAEKREFNPHLTIARFKERQAGSKIAENIRLLKEKGFGDFLIKEICLFKSILLQEGAKYIKLQSISLED